MPLLDVEGTTTPISFVAEALFPLARASVKAFIEAHRDRPDVEQIVTELHLAWATEERAARQPQTWPPDSRDAASEYALWLMRLDRKLTPLKTLQGLIWEQSYREGRLVAPVYEDVEPALQRWAARGCHAAIFSSGSVLAQRLLFAHTTAGDLTPLLGSLFDTTVGSKRDPASYASIASSLRRDPSDVLFVSDLVDELDAARFAGLDTALCVRDEALPADSGGHRIVQSLTQLDAGP